MHDDRAASAPLAFVIAGALIIGVIATALMTTNDIATPSNTGASVSANRQAQADGLVQVLLDTSGYVDGGATWTGVGDLADSGRIGLRHETLSTSLDLQKFRNLNSAPMVRELTGDDGLVSYEEAREGLGMENLDFHIRAYPTLIDVQQRLNENVRDTNLRVAYIGNQIETGGAVPEVGALTCDTSPSAIDTSSVRYSVAVKNTGTKDTQFQVKLTIDNGGKKESIKDQSELVLAGQWTTVDFDVPSTSKYECLATTKVDLDVSDISTTLVSQTGQVPNILGAPATTLAEGSPIELNQMHFTASDLATIGFTADKDEVLKWRILEDVTGTVELGQGTHVVPHKGATFTIDPADASHSWMAGWTGAWPPGTHRVVVENTNENSDAGATSTQRLTIVSGSVDPYTPSGGTSTSFDPAVAIEVDYIHKLVEKFCPTNWDSETESPLAYWGTGDENFGQQCSSFKSGALQPGDVFWDDKALLTEHVCDRIQEGTGCSSNANLPDLAETGVLIVGSNVDHNAMTAGNFKWPLRDWVHGGGTLIAFGSPETTTNWLNPIFHVAEETGTGGLGTPDPSHPLLSVPNTLDYTSYDNRGEAWRYTGNAEEHFTDIVEQGEDPITAISEPGAFGEGTILISTWLPYDPYNTGAGSAGFEGMAMLHNFLSHAYRDLFLDYGPPIPPGESVIPAFGRSQICHSYDYDEWTALPDPDEAQNKIRHCQVDEGRGLGLIDMDIAVFVFRG